MIAIPGDRSFSNKAGGPDFIRISLSENDVRILHDLKQSYGAKSSSSEDHPAYLQLLGRLSNLLGISPIKHKIDFEAVKDLPQNLGQLVKGHVLFRILNNDNSGGEAIRANFSISLNASDRGQVYLIQKKTLGPSDFQLSKVNKASISSMIQPMNP